MRTVSKATEATLDVTPLSDEGRDEKEFGREDQKGVKQSWVGTHFRERRETCYVPGISLDPFTVATSLKR